MPDARITTTTTTTPGDRGRLVAAWSAPPPPGFGWHGVSSRNRILRKRRFKRARPCAMGAATRRTTN